MKSRWTALLGLGLLVMAPLAGVLVRGLPAAFFEFPPLTPYIVHAPFSMPVTLLFAVAGVAMIGFLLTPPKVKVEPVFRPGQRPFPPWGIFGLLLNAASWIFAWGHFKWLGPFEEHMFFPLWLGYILVVDAVVYRRRGESLLSRSPRIFAALFPASAASWWYFEYLNRFVQNWWYEGIARFSATHYALFATLCFSTVLPAIFETRDLLLSFRRFQNLNQPAQQNRRIPHVLRLALAVAGAAGLFLMAIFPNPLFFLTWLSPLLLLEGLLGLAGIPTLLDDLCRGDRRQLAALALAALVCGFFWEMWNYRSLPKWHYSVPYVGRFHFFEMPAVGYSGYLPFGPASWYLWLVLNRALGRKKAD